MNERQEFEFQIPPEELHGTVQVITGQELVELRDHFQGEEFNPDLLTTGHDSQAGTWIRYGGTLLFLEADSPDFDSVQATQKLLGFT